MLKRKWKNTIILSIATFIFASIIVAFYFIILYTPNMNSYIGIKATDVLGTVTVHVKNAQNGAPYSYFQFENTTSEEKFHEFINKNLLYKGDDEDIVLEFVFHNMAHFKTNLNLNIEGPGKNAALQLLINNVKSDLFTDLILQGDEIKTITFIVGKEDVSKPIRSKFSINFSLTKYVEPVVDEETPPEEPVTPEEGGEEVTPEPGDDPLVPEEPVVPDDEPEVPTE